MTRRFTPGEIAPRTHWTGDWVDHRAGLEAMVKIKISTPARNRAPATRPVAIPFGKDLIRFLINLLIIIYYLIKLLD
jgi:hypothetical protein